MPYSNSDIILGVLPFSTGDEKASEFIKYFEEDLVYYLSKFQGISVLSYQTSSQLKINDFKRLDDFGVTHLVAGGYRNIAGKSVVNTQLIEFPKNVVIYEQRIELHSSDLSKLLDEAVLQVINTLQHRLDHSILSHSYKKPEIYLEAHELFLLGNMSLKKATPEGDADARYFFEKALEKQPNFARAYSGISSSYFNEWSCQLWDRWEVSQNGAKKYAIKAIEIDENDYISLSILGRVLLFEGDYEGSEHYLRKSLKMNSNDASILLQIAFSFIFLGFTKEAVELYDRACLLNPVHEDRYLAVGATVHFENGSFEKALEMGEKIEIEQTYVDFPVYLAAAHYYLGNEKRAYAYWSHFIRKFESHIYFKDSEKEQDPLSWHMEVNPYRHDSRLKRFWDYIRPKVNTVPKSLVNEGNAPQGKFFISVNQVNIHLERHTCTLKNTKGLLDIAKLISSPQEDIHVTELMNAMDEQQGHVHLLDKKAKKEYQNRILELQSQLAEAEEANDQAKADVLSTEYEQLMEHLSKSLGLDGRSRKVATVADKARAAVTLRIRDSIKKIMQQDASIGLHFSNSIKTGMLCAYRPEREIEWEVEGI